MELDLSARTSRYAFVKKDSQKLADSAIPNELCLCLENFTHFIKPIFLDYNRSVFHLVLAVWLVR